MRHRAPRWVWPLLAAALLVAYGVKVVRKEGDLRVLQQGARDLLAGTPIYRDEPWAFTYPPPMALVLVPFAPLPPVPARALWYALNLLLLAIATSIFRRAAGADRATAGLALLLTGRFIFSAFENQQSDLVVLACLAGLLWACREGRHFWGGVFLALGAAVKVTPLLFLPYLALKRRWRMALWGAVGFMALLALPDLLFPTGRGTTLLGEWYRMVVARVVPWEGGTPWAAGGRIWAATNVLNQSLSATLYRYLVAAPTLIYGEPVRVNLLSLSPAAARTGIFACEAALLGAMALLSLRRPRAGSGEPAEFSVVLLLMVLLSPQSSKPHFVVLLLPYLLLLGGPPGGRGRLLWGLLALSSVLLTLTAEGFVGRRLAGLFQARGCITWGTIAVGAALLVAPRGRPKGEGEIAKRDVRSRAH